MRSSKFYYCSTNGFDCFDSRSGKSICFYSQLSSQFAISQNLNHLLLRDKTGGRHLLKPYLLVAFGICQSLKGTQVDSLILYTVYILETKFRETTLQRHLTTFESDFLLISGSLLCTLMTTGRGSTHARTGSTTYPSARMSRSTSRFQITQVHTIYFVFYSTKNKLIKYCDKVLNLIYHTLKRRSQLMLHNSVHLPQTQRVKSTLLVLGSTNPTFNLLYFDCCHYTNLLYPLKTFSILMPRF